MFIISVIPLTNIPRSQPQIFSYFYKSNLIKGSIVEIPLRCRNVMAVVLNSDSISSRKAALKKADFILKPINKVISSKQIVPPLFFLLTDFISRYYFYSVSLCLKIILPRRIKSLIKYIEKLSEEKDNFPEYLQASDFKNKTNNEINFSNDFSDIVNKIKLNIKNQKQVLVLVPTIFYQNYYFTKLSSKISEPIFISSNDLKVKEFNSLWTKINSKEARLIIGRRSSPFLPWKDLGLIVVVDRNNNAYKSWDQKPYYNSAFLIKYLATYYNTSILYYEPKVLPITPIVKIIDLKKIRKERRPFQAISTSAIIEIQNTLKKGKKIVIFINRKGLATSIVCQECGFVFKCPNCDIPLGFHNEAKLICHHCNYNASIPLSCPSCRGYKLKSLGVGMDRIAEEIKKFIVPSPTFALIEGEMPDEQELDIFEKFNNGDIKILIGTEAILRPQLELVDLVIVASIDPALFLPDYNSEERVFLNFLKLKALSKEKLMIQTLIPQNKLFQYFIKNNEEKFLDEEKKWRKDYLWPPYVQLIKLTLTYKDKKRGENEAEKTKRNLEQAINKLIPENYQKYFILLGPAQAFIFKERGLYKWNIMIKYGYFESKIKEEINHLSGLNSLSPILTKKELILRNKILKCIPNNWKIDVDPINTL